MFLGHCNWCLPYAKAAIHAVTSIATAIVINFFMVFLIYVVVAKGYYFFIVQICFRKKRFTIA